MRLLLIDNGERRPRRIRAQQLPLAVETISQSVITVGNAKSPGRTPGTLDRLVTGHPRTISEMDFLPAPPTAGGDQRTRDHRHEVDRCRQHPDDVAGAVSGCKQVTGNADVASVNSCNERSSESVCGKSGCRFAACGQLSLITVRGCLAHHLTSYQSFIHTGRMALQPVTADRCPKSLRAGRYRCAHWRDAARRGVAQRASVG